MNKRIVTIQDDLKDCGAACLHSIIKYYNGYVPMEEIRLAANITKEGITAYNLILAAKKYGFASHGVKIENSKLSSLSVPFIAHLDYKNGRTHYIVVYKINKKSLIVMDPAIGLKKLSINEFLKNWTNIAIILYPLAKLPKFDKSKKLISLFFHFLLQERKLIINIIVVSLLLNIFLIINSFYFKIVSNSINLYSHYITYYIFLFFFISILLKLTFNYIREYYLNYLNKNLDNYLLLPFIFHIFNLPLNYLSTKTSGEILKRIDELESIKTLFTDIFIVIVLNTSQFLMSFIILYNINSKLTIILLVTFILYSLISLVFNNPLNKLINDNIIKDTTSKEYLTEYISNIETIKNNNYPIYIKSNIENSLNKYLLSNFNLNNFIRKYSTLRSSIYDISLFIINTYGFLMIMNSSLDILTLITFNSLISYFSEPIKSILDILPRYNYLKNVFNKISDFLNLDIESKNDNEEFINGDIVISKLKFSYNNFIYPINNLNLFIKRGSNVLIKGHSGSGKSTICKLIYRLYEPDSGNILINNINIKDYNLNTIRENISYVSQNEVLFTDTIKNNILLKRNISLKKLNNILKMCCLEEFINKQPLRLENIILPNSNNISGGQKQRLILARALIKNAKIIILDEALSQVDYQTERKIITNLIKYYQNKTIIYISHRQYPKLFDYEIDLDYV